MNRIAGPFSRSLSTIALVAVILTTLGFDSGSAATRLRPRAKAAPQEKAAIPQEADAADKGEPATRERPKGSPAEPLSPELGEMSLEPYFDGPPVQAPGVLTPSRAPEAVGQNLPGEVEPNGTAATATPIAGTSARIRANVFPTADVDVYSFTAAAGDRVYAATMTMFSASAGTGTGADSVLDVIASDGTTVLETDLDDGTFFTNSSTIAGRILPTAGTYYLRVRHNAAAGSTATLRPYDLYFQLRSGAPAAEVESNDTTATAQPFPASGWVAGSTSSATDLDFYSVNLNAGDTIYLSLDLDPERDAIEWNGQLGLAPFGTPPQILLASDAGTATPDSEAFFMTVKASGTYFIFAGVQAGTAFGSYQLSATVFPRVSPGSCTTYTSTNVPVTIPTTTGIVTSSLTVPGNPRIGKLRVNINLTHTFMQDLDVQLTSPGGTTIGLFSDIGNGVTGGPQTTMDVTLDDEAGVPINAFVPVQGMALTPEFNYRLNWLEGSLAGGTWTLTLRDDANLDGGMLSSWSLEICEAPSTFCTGGTLVPVFSTDFETDNGGFTHSGTQDEWEYGTPAFAPITTANSGTMAWKTDLDNTYNASSSQDLFSPNIVLPAAGMYKLSWAQKFQIETANFDHAFVEVREVGGSGMVRRVWEFLDADMIDNVGNPAVTLQYAAGWNLCERDISDFAGKTVQVVFHLDSDTTVQRAGYAIDDVKVETCQLGADLALTTTDAPDPVAAGGQLTYTANAVNNGPQVASTVVVTVPLPPGVTFSSVTTPAGWTPSTPAVGSGGVVTFTKPTMASAETAVFTVVTTVGCATFGALSSMTTISSSTMDPMGGNNMSSPSTTVTNAAPTVTCPANITQSNDAGVCGAVVTYATPTATDDAGCTATVVCTPASGTTFAIGTTTVTCTATDAANQTGMCTFTVTVNDTQAPTVTCPANITTGNAPNQCSAVVTYTTPTASDNCPGATVVCAPASGSTFAIGTTTVTCTATDASANTGTCTFTVTVNDTQAPAITCPANITTDATETQGDQTGATVTYPAPTVTDNCPGVAAPVCTPASGSFFPVGTTTVTCMVADGAGNPASCSFTVTVGTAFTNCYVDDATGDTLSIVSDPADPLYRLWQYRVAATGQIFMGSAESLSLYPGRALTAYDHDSRGYVMDLNVSFGSKTATATVTERIGNVRHTLRDRNITNDPPCQ